MWEFVPEVPPILKSVRESNPIDQKISNNNNERTCVWVIRDLLYFKKQMVVGGK